MGVAQGLISGEAEGGLHVLVFVSLLFAPLGFRALLPALLTMGDGEAQGTGQVVIPLLCLAGTESERSQGLQGQPHVSHYGRYFGEWLG